MGPAATAGSSGGVGRAATEISIPQPRKQLCPLLPPPHLFPTLLFLFPSCSASRTQLARSHPLKLAPARPATARELFWREGGSEATIFASASTPLSLPRLTQGAGIPVVFIFPSRAHRRSHRRWIQLGKRGPCSCSSPRYWPFSWVT